MSLEIPASLSPWNDPALRRRPLRVGSVVTGEDPASWSYGKTGRVASILPSVPDGPDPIRAIVVWDTPDRRQGVYSRAEIRDIRDRPPSAQIGWGQTVWLPE